jgi:hypothetical protein
MPRPPQLAASSLGFSGSNGCLDRSLRLRARPDLPGYFLRVAGSGQHPYDAERVGQLRKMLVEARKRKLSAGLKARREQGRR